ncbi:hypothetical protein ACQ4PT_036080 [Festuca glaucescens]
MDAAADASSGVRPNRAPLLNLPSGYHFAPTEEELIIHYLRPKIAGLKSLLPIFIQTDVISSGPEEITEKYRDYGADKRWFFFTTRKKKYLSGNRPNRTTKENGCWKATGPQRLIRSVGEGVVGRVRTLVFYGAPPKETDQETGLPTGKKRMAQSEDKTPWTMYEYELWSEEEQASGLSVDKLDELVLCTIQEQKKKEGGKEGSGAGEKKVKEDKEKGKIKAAGKKRKGNQEVIKAENIADDLDQMIQDLHAMKRPKVPMLLPPHPETFAPKEGYESGMFDYNNFPMKSSPRLMLQDDESPLSETVSPGGIVDNDYYHQGHQNMAPTPSLHEPPHSEMMSIPTRGSHNTGSVGSGRTSWLEGLPDLTNLHWLPGKINSCNLPIAPMPVSQEPRHQRMMREYETSSHSGYSHHNMMTYQPATNYPYSHVVAAPATDVAYSYGSAAQNTAKRHDSHVQPDPGFMDLLLNSGPMSSQGLRGRFAGSTQYHGGPSGLAQGRDVTPAAALPRQDQVMTARM